MAEIKTADGRTYRLTKYETETIISMNDDEPTADIGTWQAPMIRKLDKLAEKFPAEVIADIRPNEQPRYRVPKSWIKVRPPRQISEETRQKMVEQLRNRK